MVVHSNDAIINITTSEGNLKRYGRICQLVGFHQISQNKFTNQVKNNLGLTNKRVIERHLNILQKLGLLKKEEELIFLTDEGKALTKYLEKKIILDKNLCYFEKLFFLKQILLVDKAQIELILELSLKYKKKDLILMNYTDKFEGSARYIENRFNTFEKWLKDLDILTKKNNEIKLSRAGIRLHNAIQEKNEYFLLKKYSNSDKILEHKILLERLIDAIKDYRPEYDIINYRPIRIILSLTLMEGGYYVSLNDIDSALRNLADKNEIRSVIIGRDGKPAGVILLEHP